MTTTERSLLDAVLADPADDLPRLVYADWLDENCDPLRANFIRWQCDMPGQTTIRSNMPADATGFDDHGRQITACFASGFDHRDQSREPVRCEYKFHMPFPCRFIVSRGFVGEVECSLEAFVGQECRHCGPCSGSHRGDGRPGCPRERHHHCDDRCRTMRRCWQCDGRGRVGNGFARWIGRDHPVVKVTFVDEMREIRSGSGVYAAFHTIMTPQDGQSHRVYPREPYAREADSRLAVDLLRRNADLKAITWPDDLPVGMRHGMMMPEGLYGRSRANEWLGTWGDRADAYNYAAMTMDLATFPYRPPAI